MYTPSNKKNQTLFYFSHLEAPLIIGPDSKSSFMLSFICSQEQTLNSGLLLSSSNPITDDPENPKTGKNYSVITAVYQMHQTKTLLSTNKLLSTYSHVHSNSPQERLISPGHKLINTAMLLLFSKAVSMNHFCVPFICYPSFKKN